MVTIVMTVAIEEMTAEAVVVETETVAAVAVEIDAGGGGGKKISNPVA